ncbi:hypothetical protein AWZ03_015410, partial [Drosophila navojoa]
VKFNKDRMDHKELEDRMVRQVHNACSMALVRTDNRVRTQVIHRGREVNKAHTDHLVHTVHFLRVHNLSRKDHRVPV